MAPATNTVARRAERIYVRMPVTVLVESQGQKFLQVATTVDFSQNGVRIRTKSELAPGQIVDVIPGGEKGVPTSYRVVWMRTGEADQAAEAGLELLN